MVINNAHTLLDISSTFGFLSWVCFDVSIFFRIVHILPALAFPLSHLRHLLSCLCRRIFGFGGTGLADFLGDLLCGTSFTLVLSPLATQYISFPFAHSFRGVGKEVLKAGMLQWEPLVYPGVVSNCFFLDRSLKTSTQSGKK